MNDKLYNLIKISFFLLTFLSVLTRSDTTVAKTVAKEDTSMALVAKPLLCVTGDSDNRCEIDLLLAWETSDVGRYCLFLHQNENALQCWLQHSQGQWRETKTIQHYAHFWMSRGKTDKKLAEVRVDVLNINPKEKRRNRRRRHVWSLF